MRPLLVVAAVCALIGCGTPASPPEGVACQGKAPAYKADDGPLRLQPGCHLNR